MTNTKNRFPIINVSVQYIILHVLMRVYLHNILCIYAYHAILT